MGWQKRRQLDFCKINVAELSSDSRSGEHLAAIEQDFAQGGALFIKQPVSGGAHGFEQITSLVQTRDVDVVSACVEKFIRLHKHVGSGDDFCSRVEFAQKTNEPRIRRPLEQRIWNSGDEHLGFIHTGVHKRVPVRNVTIDDGNASFKKAIPRNGAKVHHRDVGDQFRIVTLDFFQKRTGRAKLRRGRRYLRLFGRDHGNHTFLTTE